MIDRSTTDRLYARLRREPLPHTVRGSLPVLSFGDPDSAQVATVGLNPSDQEYLDNDGRELTGVRRRFETLSSLGATGRSALTDEQCARALETMRAYFQPGKPVYPWFRPLDRVARAMGYAYDLGQVVHLDLVQEATKPKWSALQREFEEEVRVARKSDGDFLRWQIETSRLQVLVCNGRTVYDGVRRLLGADALQEDEGLDVGAGRRWYVGRAAIAGRTVALLGWNRPLAQAPGLTADTLEALGRLLLDRARHHGLLAAAAATPSPRVGRPDR